MINLVLANEKAMKKALDNLQHDGVLDKYIENALANALSNILVCDSNYESESLDVFFESNQLLNGDVAELESRIDGLIEENNMLKLENKNLKLDIIDALNKSDNIPCTCNPCVVSEYIKDNVLFKEDKC